MKILEIFSYLMMIGKIIRFITHKDKVPHNIKDIYNYCYTYLQNGGHNIQVLIDEQTIKTKHSSIKFNDISALNDWAKEGHFDDYATVWTHFYISHNSLRSGVAVKCKDTFGSTATASM